MIQDFISQSKGINLDIEYDVCQDVKGKKLLILAGAPQHCKLVRAAQAMGVYTIVTDYLADSPAKEICDKSYMIDVKDVSAVVEMCRKEQVDGVLSAYIDPCQVPYERICRQLQLPCYASREQFLKMTNKREFKELCRQNDVPTIPEYLEEDIHAGRVEYPIFIKPVDGRGSRGQTICYQKSQVQAGIEFAKSESSNGDIVIEKYIQGAREFQVTYFFISGEAYLVRLTDDYQGSPQKFMQKVTACGITPSDFTAHFIATVHPKLVLMFQALGIKNGPAFMQGFEANGQFMFFDPGLRFPGADFEMTYKKVFGIDLMRAMVRFALTGSFGDLRLPSDGVYLAGHRAATLFPTLKSGVIADICGEDMLKKDCHIVSYHLRHKIGDSIGWTYDINQRLGEVDIYGADTEDLIAAIEKVQDALSAKDDMGQNMTLEKFPTAILRER